MISLRIMMSRVLALFLSFISSVLTADDVFTSPTVADVPALIGTFEDPNVRLGASQAIVTIGKPAVLPLEEALRSGKVDEQLWSAYTLGKIGPAAAAAAPALTDLLRSQDRHLRAVAARSLGQIRTNNTKAIELLATSITDGDARVRRWAVVALGQIGPAAKTALPQLVDALDDQSVRAKAIQSIVQIGKDAIPLLKDVLANDVVRLEAAEVLCQLDPAAAKRLGIDKPTKADLTALRLSLHNNDKDIEARTNAAKRLGMLGTDAAPILVTAFADSNDEVANAAAMAFCDVGASAVPLLRETLGHESAQVRAAALDALAAIGPGAEDALSEVIDALTDADRDVRHRAVKTLDAFGPVAEPAVSALIAVVQNPRDLEATRQLAIKTLARIASSKREQVIAALRESAKDSNFGVSSLAKQMLKTIEAKD